MARLRQRDEEVGIGCVFWCPVSAVQPTEKRSVPIGPPSERGQGDFEYAPAGPFRQVDCLGRPAVCERPRGGARDVVVTEVLGNQRRRNPSVLRCYAALWWAWAVHCPGVSRAGRVRRRRWCETGCRSRGSLRSITLRVGEVVDLPAPPDGINDATPCRSG